MQPLTIIHTEASCGWGGQDIRVLSEAEWFRAKGHRVVLVTPPEGELFKRATAAGFDPIPMALKKNSQLGDFFRLRALFKKLRPDVVGTHSSVDSWVGLLAAKTTGVKCRLRYRHVSTPVKANAANRWQYKQLATHVITTGESISGHLVEKLGLDSRRVTCVSTGIEAPLHLPEKDASRRALANELGLPDSAHFVGQVSVLRSWKGHADLMRAFAQIAGEFPSLHLVFVGEGPYRGKIENDRAPLAVAERIHLLGHREKPWALFRAMDACCLCSTGGEGIPQALMQAMLAGTPAIGTDIGGIPEVVRHGETGLIVPPGAPDHLAEALRKILTQPDVAGRLAENARARTLAERSPDTMGNAVSRIISTDLTSRQ